ncbi:ATP-binding protein [Bradyrhizobium sp.]
MAFPTLSSAIVQSLRAGHMHPDLPAALLSQERNRVRVRGEDRHWDYKEKLPLADPYAVAEFAKDVLAFHNTDGGVIIVGVTDKYAAHGVPSSSILDKKQLRDKLVRYCGSSVEIFQESIELTDSQFIWLIFITKYVEAPQAMASDGPYHRGAYAFNKGQYFYRDGDEVKRCRSDGDIERVFRGFSNAHIGAYNYEVDQSYYRLLHPNCEKFIGRREKVDEVKTKLGLRHPVIALDGLGGVGKTAIAIQAVRELYDDTGRYLFIASLSAKSKMWLGHVSPRAASFAGLHGLLSGIADVIPEVQKTDDTHKLKASLIDFMKDINGLILVDNLEEIYDDGVFKFLSQEVPAPVKVLVTSRIAKDLGALTISIPAMASEESRDLLALELDRLGYEPKKEDEEHVAAILQGGGGVPLAIKWAAQLAAARRSIKEASAILRGAGLGKQEFLSFCFATMYDALTEGAKNAAKLIPYLDLEWKPMTLSVMLDLPPEAVRLAIYELADQGIIYRTNEIEEDDYGVLPLTKEFLSNKWHENQAFRKQVIARLDEMFESEGAEGVLLEWSEERRVQHLTPLARKRTELGDHQRALKMINLAQSWLDAKELHKQGIILRFLEGRNLYALGRKAGGIAHMHQAVTAEAADDSLQAGDFLFFAETLFTFGGLATEKDACQNVAIGIQRGAEPSMSVWSAFVDCTIKRNDLKPLASIISSLEDINLTALVFDRLGKLLVGTPGHTFVNEWAGALNRILTSPNVEDEKKSYYRDLVSENRTLTARLKPNS